MIASCSARRAKSVFAVKPGFEVVHFLCVDVEAGHFEPRLRQQQRERQPNVAQPDHSNPGGARLNAIETLPRNPRQNELAGLWLAGTGPVGSCLAGVRLAGFLHAHDYRIQSFPSRTFSPARTDNSNKIEPPKRVLRLR